MLGVGSVIFRRCVQERAGDYEEANNQIESKLLAPLGTCKNSFSSYHTFTSS